MWIPQREMAKNFISLCISVKAKQTTQVAIPPLLCKWNVQSSLLFIYWQSYQNTLAWVWNLPGCHYIPLLQSTSVVFVMFQREASQPRMSKNLRTKSKTRYLGLTRQNQLWLYANYFEHVMKTHVRSPWLFYTFFEYTVTSV